MARGILNGLVALLLAGTFLFPYVGGAVTAYVLIGLSLLLIAWNFVRPPRLAFDPGAWMFVIAWGLIAVAFMLTSRPGSSDYLLSVNFAMFALYPLLSGALQRFAGPHNTARVAVLALAGSFMVSYCRARAEGLGMNCEVGLLQRPERIIVLGIGLMLSELTHPLVLIAVLIALAVMTNFTALQRMRHVAKLFEERAGRR